MHALQAEERALYESLLNSLPLGVYRIDREGHITYANSLFAEMLGAKPDDISGKLFYDFFPEHLASHHRKDDQWIMTTLLPIHKTPATGPQQYRREIKSPVFSATGEVIGVQGIFWDVSELMQAHADLKESEERFNLFMDTMPAAVFMKDDESTTLYCNRYMLDIIGAKKWLGKKVHDHFPPELAQKMIEDDKNALKAGYVVVEEHVPHADGELKIYQTHKFAIPRQGMQPLLGGIALDITVNKQAELELQTLNARLQTLATTDQLTGLANRRRMTEILEHEISRQKRYEKTFAVIMIDIDHFKAINDHYGHQAGDSVLTQISALFGGTVREVDFAGRWGGEEFLIVCPETGVNGAAKLAEQIRQRCELHDFGIPVTVTASFGVAESKPGATVDALMKAADDALYMAKKTRNCVIGA